MLGGTILSLIRVLLQLDTGVYRKIGTSQHFCGSNVCVQENVFIKEKLTGRNDNLPI